MQILNYLLESTVLVAEEVALLDTSTLSTFESEVELEVGVEFT